MDKAYDINTIEERKELRKSITAFEGVLRSIDGAYIGDSELCPLKHTFSDDIYVREIFIPKGTMIVGKIHKHKHPNFLMSGKVKVITENGVEILKAPKSMISDAGTKRALYALTDLVWITVHSNPTNTRELKCLEENIIADSYDSFNNFIESKKSIKNKIKNLLIKKLLL